MALPDGPQSEPPPPASEVNTDPQTDASSAHQHAATSCDPAALPDAQRCPQPRPESEHGLEPESEYEDHNDEDPVPDGTSTVSRSGMIRRVSRNVVPGLPRAQTFKRKQSEERDHLAPVEPTLEERRAVSMERRTYASHTQPGPVPGTSGIPVQPAEQQYPESVTDSHAHLTEDDIAVSHMFQGADVPLGGQHMSTLPDNLSSIDTHSVTTSQYDALIHQELETRWILNLSMHFKDSSKREKFFVTYREHEHLWRRVTVSLDYRGAPEESLEMDLLHTKYQREKSARIYEAIRDSLPDIQFYDTVTNLKLETTDGRLHVHVVEDGNEIIQYPSINQLAHLGCEIFEERDIEFDSHMSGFVYKVRVGGQSLIKKEIPSPDTIEEFLYEINALNSLAFSDNIIQFHGLVVDEYHECVKGLLISYADRGALIDIIYDHKDATPQRLDWATIERWARQIVQGLADVHESGFVQGDFTLSNIVIDDKDNAKIIDINRRGCPVGWEPPEATPLIETNHRISMYIGVKSDLYQLGMVLWAIAMGEDEPETHGRPLVFEEGAHVPDWYRRITEICLNPDPRRRMQASMLLQLFPDQNEPAEILVENGASVQAYPVHEFSGAGYPRIKTAQPPLGWDHMDRMYDRMGPPAYESWNYNPPRGRSPPSPMPSNLDNLESEEWYRNHSAWMANKDIRPSYSDIGIDDLDHYSIGKQPLFAPQSQAPVEGTISVHEDLSEVVSNQPTSAVVTGDAGRYYNAAAGQILVDSTATEVITIPIHVKPPSESTRDDTTETDDADPISIKTEVPSHTEEPPPLRTEEASFSTDDNIETTVCAAATGKIDLKSQETDEKETAPSIAMVEAGGTWASNNSTQIGDVNVDTETKRLPELSELLPLDAADAALREISPNIQQAEMPKPVGRDDTKQNSQGSSRQDISATSESVDTAVAATTAEEEKPSLALEQTPRIAPADATMLATTNATMFIRETASSSIDENASSTTSTGDSTPIPKQETAQATDSTPAFIDEPTPAPVLEDAPPSLPGEDSTPDAEKKETLPPVGLPTFTAKENLDSTLEKVSAPMSEERPSERVEMPTLAPGSAALPASEDNQESVPEATPVLAHDQSIAFRDSLVSTSGSTSINSQYELACGTLQGLENTAPRTGETTAPQILNDTNLKSLPTEAAGGMLKGPKSEPIIGSRPLDSITDTLQSPLEVGFTSRSAPCTSSPLMMRHDSLAGIGSGHLMIDDELIREKYIPNDEFRAITRPEALV